MWDTWTNWQARDREWMTARHLTDKYDYDQVGSLDAPDLLPTGGCDCKMGIYGPAYVSR